ncbi:MAG: HAD family hydrolase [Methanophagales archaeon ANME-1-THS]|nr:MAG: HAD family hydrolase [Methanophagales archaeon ANME-1-THS]
MMAVRKIDAILFDLDGVLINSFESWYQAFTNMLTAYGKKKLSRETFKARCWGPDLRHNLGALQLGEDAAEYCVREQIKLIPLIELFPGAEEVVRQTRERYKCKVGLVTNTPRENVDKILAHFQLSNHFDAVITGDDVKKGKPDPEMVITACKRLNVKPDRVILVGDTKADYQAGKAAGCIVIGMGSNAAGDLHIEQLGELFLIMDKSANNDLRL